MDPIVVRSLTIGDPARTAVMGVLNVTPDSFSDGGRFVDVGAAVAAGLALVRAGADVIDVGGESTRPDAEVVTADLEIARVVPVIEGLRAAGCAAVVSIDSLKAAVAEAALAAGADLVNDVSGGALDPAILAVAARHGAPMVLGHLRGTPQNMMRDVHFGDVVGEVGGELAARVAAARAAGVAHVVIDPGLGFGKQLEHNLALIAAASALRARVGCPLLVGPSRKSFLGRLTGIAVPAERDYATAAAVTACILAGADAVRVHAVAELVPAIRVADALRKSAPPRAYQGAA